MAIERHDFAEERPWTLDEIVGYLFSTSYSAAHLFGDRLDSFVEDLESALCDLSPDRVFYEPGQFSLVIGTLPA